MNYELNLFITPQNIYDKLSEKDEFDNIRIIGAKLLDDGNVEIQCLALKDAIIEPKYRQNLFNSENITIN